MSLAESLLEHVRACFTGLWIESHEPDEALVELARLSRQEGWRLATWDIDSGLSVGSTHAELRAADPLTAVRALASLATPDGTTLLVLVNFHRFLQSSELVEALRRQITAGKQTRTFVVILAPVVQIPIELDKQFVVLTQPLPDREQLAEIARGVATEPGELPDAAGLHAVLDAAAGLTRYEAEGAFSLALVRHGRLEPQTLWELKSQTLRKHGLLTLHRGGDAFADLGGLDRLKAFCHQALTRAATGPERPRPRGVLLLSPPGCGKSQFAKALGNETGRPTLVLDIGSLMGGLVGLTEQRTRQVLAQIDAMAPAIVMIDEVEKALGGVGTSGSHDAGVTARLFGTLLTWLNDHTSDVFVVCTCNDIRRLPPEFSRAERFDAVYFVDLPDAAQRQAIWSIWRTRFGIEPTEPQPADTDWTGAEIRACCRLSALLDCSLVEAAQYVVPVARTSGESIARLRQWAAGRCLAADRPGLYRPREAVPGKRARVSRHDPSAN